VNEGALAHWGAVGSW